MTWGWSFLPLSTWVQIVSTHRMNNSFERENGKEIWGYDGKWTSDLICGFLCTLTINIMGSLISQAENTVELCSQKKFSTHKSLSLVVHYAASSCKQTWSVQRWSSSANHVGRHHRCVSKTSSKIPYALSRRVSGPQHSSTASLGIPI